MGFNKIIKVGNLDYFYLLKIQVYNPEKGVKLLIIFTPSLIKKVKNNQP